MDLDDLPVGGGAGAKPFEAPTTPAEDFGSCSTAELITHANWKARKEGYERMRNAPAKHKALLLDHLKAVAGEGNATVQEAAIEALVAVLPECTSAEREDLADGTLSLVVEKGITGRSKAAQASQDFASSLVHEGNSNAVFAVLLPAFAHRTPKNRLAATQLAASLVSNYGVQHLPTKEILKAMQPLFNDANAQVRKEAATLCCECYRYLGAGIKGFLTDLRDVQLQELQKQFDTVTVGGAPPKSVAGATSSDGLDVTEKSATAAAVKPATSLTGTENSAAMDDAACQMLDETPVIPKLPKKFFRAALDKEKAWQDRVDYVNEHLTPLLAAPRFRAKDDYHELASMMKEYLVDPQAPLMLLGFKMIQDCARGLRSDFSPYAKLYIAPLLEKMKDKKVSVLLHVMKTLEDLICYNCITMDQCNDEMDAALQSKNPTQRTAVVNFCIRMVDVLGDKNRYTKLGRSIAMLTRLVNDEKPSIRDVAYVLLDKLIQAFSEAQYKSVLATLDDNQRHNMAVAVTRGAPPVGPRSLKSGATSTLNTPHVRGAAGAVSGSALVSCTPSDSPAKKIARVDGLGGSTSSSVRPASRLRTVSASGLPHAARCLSTSTGGGEAGPSSASPLPRGSTVRSGVPPLPGRASLNNSTVLSRSAGSGNLISARSNAGKPPLEDGISLESTLPAKMDSVTMILGLLGGDSTVVDTVRSSEWSRRLGGLTMVLTMVQQWTPAEATRDMSYLVVFLRAHPSFREPIFQVLHLMIQVFQEAISKAPTLSPGAGYAIVSGLATRLSEPKNKQAVLDMYALITSKLGSRFVVRHMLDTAAMAKTPKLTQEVCAYVREVVRKYPDSEEADAEAVELRGVLHFIKTVCGADANNASVRQETVLLLVELRRAARGAAAIEKFAAALPPPLPAAYEREVNRSESERSKASPMTLPLPPSTRTSPSISLTVAAASSPPPKRVRTSSQSSATGMRAHLTAPSPHRSASTQQRSVGEAPAGSGIPPLRRRSLSASTSGPAGLAATTPAPAASHARVSIGRTSSLNASLRNSTAGLGATTSTMPPSSLRPILNEIASGEDWRDRLNGLHHAEDYVANTPHPLPGNCAAPLLKALQNRFEDANKNVVVEVLRFVPVIVDAAEPEECRAALRKLAPGVLGMLGDQKTALREEARNVAFLAMRVVGLELMLPLLQKPLGSDSNACRQNTLELMVSGFEQLPAESTLPRAGMQPLTPAVISSMMDRILEVRIIAEQVLGWMIGVVGEDFVLQCVKQLKPAEQQVVMPAIERQLEHQRQPEPEPEPAQLARGPSPLDANLNASANSLYANEESQRTTPRAGTPRTRNGATETPTHRGGPATNGATPTAETRKKAPTPLRGRLNENTAPQPTSSATTAVAPRLQHAASTSGSQFALPKTATSTVRTHSPVVAPRKEAAPVAVKSTAASTVATVSGTNSYSNTTNASATAAAAAPDAARKSPKVKPTTKEGSPTPREPAVSEQEEPVADATAAPSFSENSPSPSGVKEEVFTIREIVAGLRSATADVALRMCRDFIRHLRAGVDCGSPEVMQAMVERLCENTQHFDGSLAAALIESLTAMFTSARSAARFHAQLLTRVAGAFFDCLLSEKFSLHESVIKALNAMTLRMLENCRTDDVFSALLSRLTAYSTAYLATGHRNDQKYIQVTVKCIMRVDFAKVSADTTVLCCHEYLLQHPPSAFRNLDDMPIRTVKTILQSATKRHGAALLTTAEKLVGPQNLVTHFIRACLEMQEKAAKDKGQNEEQAIEESRRELRASHSLTPPPATKETATTTSDNAAATALSRRTANASTTTPRKKRAGSHVDPHVTVKDAPGPLLGSQVQEKAARPPATVSTTLAPPLLPSAPAVVHAASPSANVPPQTVSLAASATKRTPVKSHPRLSGTTSDVSTRGSAANTARSSSHVVHALPSPHSGRTATAGGTATPKKAGTPHGDTKKDLADIFARIRNHVSSAEGLDELYAFLKRTPPSRCEESFKLQFNRCSEAFRLYIKRKLERKMEDDASKPTNFRLPEVVSNLH